MPARPGRSFLCSVPVLYSVHRNTQYLFSYQGPVVQSIVSLTSSLRGQLVKCFMTLKPNILKFFVEKMREAFAMQKLLTFFQQKIMAHFIY